MQDSRVGFRGTHDLGDGMKAFFTAESGFNVTSGRLNDAGQCLSHGNSSYISCSNSSMMGQLFGRQAFVGLSDQNMGSIAMGRNYNMVYDVFTTYDPAHKSDLFSPLGISGTIGGGGGISENSRVDNSIKYKNKIDNVNIALLVGTGNQNGQREAGQGFAAQVGYESDSFGIQFVGQNFKNVLKGAKNASYDTLDVYSVNLQSTLLALKYKTSDTITIKGGVENYQITNSSTTFNTTNLNSFYGYSVGNVYNMNSTGVSETANATVTYIGGDWNATPKLNVALGFYNINNDASSVLKYETSAYQTTATSIILDYKNDKQIDTYLGLMYVNFSGDKITSSYWSSNYVFGAGVRFKF
jgi:predicted porin